LEEEIQEKKGKHHGDRDITKESVYLLGLFAFG